LKKILGVGDSNDVFFCLYAAIVTLFTSWTIYYTLPVPYVFQSILILLILTKYHNFTKRKIRLFFLFLVLSLLFYYPGGWEVSLYGILRAILISAFFLIDEKDLRIIYAIFFRLLAFVVAIGLFLHIISIFGVQSPQIATIFSGDRYYDVYFLHVYQSGLTLRFNSIFDEPGYLGTIAGLYLALEGLNLKKIDNLILFIGGLFTLSLAFYFLCLIIVVFITIQKRNIWLLLAVLSLSFALYYLFPELSDLFWGRGEFVSLQEGGFFNDSRGGVEDASENIRAILSYPLKNVFFGNGHDTPFLLFGDNMSMGISGSNIFRLIFQIGFLGVAYLVAFVFINVKKNLIYILFACVFTLSLYQRPEVFTSIHTLLIAVAFFGTNKKESK